MGVTAYAHLRLGIPLQDSDLWTVVGHRRRCPNHHEAATPEDAFCPKCGKPFENAEELEPTKGFAAWAEEEGCSPDDLYQGMIDNDEICSTAPVQSSMRDDSDRILCIELRTGSDYSDKTGPLSFEELEEAKGELKKKAERLGIQDRPMALYCSLYWSC